MARRKYTSLPYTEYPVAAGNFGPESERRTIDTLILHSTAGTYQSSVNWFNNPQAGTSAHYVIANDGRLAAMLEEYLVGYHSGNYSVNQRSIGIEHEGYSGLVRKDTEYATSAKLVADICKFYNIPIDRAHIKPHREIVATACPTDLDVDRIIRDAKAIANPLTPSPVISDATWAKIAKESKEFVFGYKTHGTVTQRMAKVIEVYKRNGVTK